ncbi:PQQ-dependent sugar dehydrogenase [Sphingomonas sp.]|uniref:PQQ-dependent sugar dehydrogenase n=1 Tax=Sphingomonas sp. TaxID=28214 RepID=UPI0035BC7535
MKTVAFAAAVLLAGPACSAQPQADRAMTPDVPPQPASATQPVPANAPLDPAIRNVPAAAGHANRHQSAPPFAIAPIGQFDAPFAMAFLPGGDLLVTEKVGRMKLRTADGSVAEVAGVPAVAAGGQGGLLDVAPAPDFARSHVVYWTFAEAGQGGSALALARGTLTLRQVQCVSAPCPPQAALSQAAVIWRSGSNGPGGQFGASIAFSPDGRFLFLGSGERQRFTPAQDPQQLLGKIVRLTLDGRPAPGNPAEPGQLSDIWSSGHRNPYGLVFAPGGRLWEVEMGPKGGDEINLIEPGRNYGWPIVSNGDNYSGQPIPDHPSRPDLAAPTLWWNPSISPSSMMLYTGAMFPQYRGSLFVGAMSTAGLIRVTLNGAKASPAEFWDFGARIRDVAQAPDGAIWLLEDGARGSNGRLLRLTPKP